MRSIDPLVHYFREVLFELMGRDVKAELIIRFNTRDEAYYAMMRLKSGPMSHYSVYEEDKGRLVPLRSNEILINDVKIRFEWKQPNVETD